MIKPLARRLLVEPTEEKAGGLIVPDSSKERPGSGTVLAAGEKATLAVGAVVMFDKFAGSKIHEGGRDYLLVDERDVIAVLGAK